MRFYQYSIAVLAFASAVPAFAQTPAPAPVAPPPPATKMEAFKPSAGSIVTMGFDVIGRVRGVRVEVREIGDSRNARSVRGLLVQVTESEYREERSFVDVDEISELIKGTEALLAITANPTSHGQFETRLRH